MQQMLEIHNLSVNYGKIRALQGISLTIHSGEIVALVGANGAGKSSILNSISGLLKNFQGDIYFAGSPLNGLPSHKISALGLVQVPEGRLIFANLTIRENLLLGAYGAINKQQIDDKLESILVLFPILKDYLDQPGANLSGGQAQLLALARGLMNQPKLLLLDEPSLGLSPIATQEIFALIKKLPAQGTTILLVEQNVRQALGIADRAYVLANGKIISHGFSQTILHDEHLVKNVFRYLVDETPPNCTHGSTVYIFSSCWRATKG